MASLVSAVARVGGGTFASRLLGFVRDLVIARLFGADAGTDAFFVAFKVPNLLRRLFTEGALAMALVPALTEVRRQQGEAALKALIDALAGILLLLLSAATLVGILAAPLLVLALAPGFAADADKLAMTLAMLRLTLPYLFFIGLTALAGAILNSRERFAVPAATPVLLNLALIGCALLLAPHLARPVEALAWGVLLAGVVQLLFQLPFLARLGLLPRPRFAPLHPGLRRIARSLLPVLVAASVTQLGLLIDTLLASFLVTGSVSWLYYSDRLMEFPLGLLGVALGIAILPRLSQVHGGGSPAAFSATLDWALRWVLVLGLPAAVGLGLLAGPIIAVLFHSEAFGDADVSMAARSLMAYAPGLVALMGIKVLSPGFFSRHDSGTPLRIALLALAANLVLSLVLMGPLAHAGLALGTTVAALLNAGLLLAALKRQGSLRAHRGWPRLVAQVGLGSAGMALVLWLGAGPTLSWIGLPGAVAALHLGLLIVGGAGVYGALVLLLGLRPRHLRLSGA